MLKIKFCLDGVPHLCGHYRNYDDDDTPSKCYSYNATLDTWTFSGRLEPPLNLSNKMGELVKSVYFQHEHNHR